MVFGKPFTESQVGLQPRAGTLHRLAGDLEGLLGLHSPFVSQIEACKSWGGCWVCPGTELDGTHQGFLCWHRHSSTNSRDLDPVQAAGGCGPADRQRWWTDPSGADREPQEPPCLGSGGCRGGEVKGTGFSDVSQGRYLLNFHIVVERIKSRGAWGGVVG